MAEQDTAVVATDPDNPTVEVIDIAPLPDTAEDDDTPQQRAEQDARAQGWRPQDEWKGAPDKWKDAGAFLRLKDTAKNENLRLNGKLSAAEARLQELERREAVRQQANDKFQIDSMYLERKAAFEAGDYNRVNQIDDKLVDLKLGKAQQKAPEAPQINAETQQIWHDFVGDPANAWIGEAQNQQRLEREMRMMLAAGETARGGDLLDLAADRVKRLYPEILPRRTAMAEGNARSSAGGGVNGSRSWNDLKPQVKSDLEDLIRITPGLKRENVLKRCTADQFKR